MMDTTLRLLIGASPQASNTPALIVAIISLTLAAGFFWLISDLPSPLD